MRNIYFKACINIIIFCLVILGLLYVLPQILVFFMPFLIGAIIAWISSPLVRFFERKLKIRRKTGTAVVIVSVIALVITAGYLLGIWMVEEIIAFLEEWPQMWSSIQSQLIMVWERLAVLLNYLPAEIKDTVTMWQDNLGEMLGNMVTDASMPTFEAVGRFAKNLPSVIIAIVMCLLSSYFFVAERDYMMNTLPGYIPKGLLSRWDLIKKSLKRAVGGYFRAQLKIEVWIYLLLVAGLLILRVKYAFLIALGIAILDFLPFFGTGAILLPWAVVEFLNSNYKSFIGLLIIWGVGQLVRQVIQPKIMGDSIGMAPIPTLFLLYIGYKLAGVIGMIVAVPIGIIVVNLYQEGVFLTIQKSLEILLEGLKSFGQLDTVNSSKMSSNMSSEEEERSSLKEE